MDNEIVELFKKELGTYPEGSVAHSVCRVELLPCLNNFGSILEGVSVSSDTKVKAKRFAFNFISLRLVISPVVPITEDEFLHDKDKRRICMDWLVDKLTGEWEKNGVQWGVSH